MLLFRSGSIVSNMPLNVVKVKSGVAFTRHITPDDVLAAWLAGPSSAPWGSDGHAVGSARDGLQAVLFDLDGVLVDTAEFHYQSWKRLADEMGLPFDRQVNDGFRGVGRMECLDKLLGGHSRDFAMQEKTLLAERKNGYYLQLVKRLTPRDLAAGARALAMHLRAADVRMALVSASKNARLVVELLGIADWFDIIVDGTAALKSKPHPESFLAAATGLKIKPHRCVVIEDAEAGIRAGLAAKMHCVGVGNAARGAHLTVPTVGALTLEVLEELHTNNCLVPQATKRVTHAA